MDKEALKVLREARALIADESHWTQGDLALDQDGKVAMPMSGEAVCWCAEGAMVKAYGAGPAGCVPGFGTLIRAAVELGSIAVWQLNDSGSHPDVLKMFDRAIEIAEEAP